MAATGIADLAQLTPIESPTDVAQLRTELAQAQKVNESVRQVAQARIRKTSLEKVASDAAILSDELTVAMRARDKSKNDAIAAAKMPVEGLGFGNELITLNGLPFNQASDAEQLRASIAISMRSNSKLKVVRVRDGSLLDNDSFALLAKMAAENGMQVWVETVRSVTDSAIIIEDGRVKGAKAGAGEAA